MTRYIEVEVGVECARDAAISGALDGVLRELGIDTNQPYHVAQFKPTEYRYVIRGVAKEP